MNLICGINPVLEALNARTRHFDRLLVVKGLRNRRVSEAIAHASRLGIALRFEARETLDRLAGGVPHQGLIAVVSAKPVLSLDSVLERARTPALLLLLDGVEDPRNLGAILRTAEAAGADAVLLPERHSAGLSETVGRASAGALEHVNVARVGNVVQTLETLKARGFWIVGFDASATQRWDAVDMSGPVVLVLGGEGRGIRRLVREHCDHLAALPLFGHVASLNVSVAAGVALYEAVRQRGSVPSNVRPIAQRPSAARHIQGPASGDGEEDPGAGRSHADPDEGHDPAWEPAPLVLLEEEDAAWAAGPTVLKPVMGRRVRTDRDRPHGKRRHKRGRDRDRGERHPPPPAPAEGAPPPEAAGEGQKPRRKRRRRGRGPRPGGAPGAEPRRQAVEGAPPG
ncbi:MAG TPA: 23S rRNA (guanosine(2251)-2'-O)-methyltransferase RlmB, partial [Vicinamibacteria bacterium]|nr:23S rRNA (guanosine(2251)-2'-O)-methyltransferase RlmB [Vicinamibacteria bacterium]